MKKIKILVILILISIIMLMSVGINTLAFDVNSKAAILIDTKTNTVIYKKDINTSISPGAFAKVMTAIVVIENSKLEDRVTISQDIISKMKDGQNYVTFYAGEELTVKDLLYCMILDSSNLAAYALANHISGSEEAFSKLMNEKAKLVGATNTNFTNPHGIYNQNQHSTVWDCYIISEYATRNQQLMEILSAQQYKILANGVRTKDTLFYSNNHLVSGFKSSAYYYRFAKGIIGGYTKESGYVASSVASMSKTGMNLIFVGVGSEKTDNTSFPAFLDARKIFEETFSAYSIKTIIKEGQQVAESKLSLSLEKDFVPIVTKQTVSVVLPKDVKVEQLEYKKIINTDIKAPIKKGDVLGTYEVYYEGKLYASTPLISNVEIQGSFFLIFIDFVIGFFTNPVTRVLFILFVIILVSYILITVRINKRRNIFKNKANKKYNNRG